MLNDYQSAQLLVNSNVIYMIDNHLTLYPYLPIKGEEGVVCTHCLSKGRRVCSPVRTDVPINGEERVVRTDVPIKGEEGVVWRQKSFPNNKQ